MKATIKSKLDYSSLITHISSKKNLDITQKIINSGLRASLGLTKTTPILSIANISTMAPRAFQNKINILKYITKNIYNDREFNNENSPYKNLTEEIDIIQKCPRANIIKDREKCKNLLLIDSVATKKRNFHT